MVLNNHHFGCASCEHAFQCQDISDDDPRFNEINELADEGSIPVVSWSDGGSIAGARVNIRSCRYERLGKAIEGSDSPCPKSVEILAAFATEAGLEIITRQDLAWNAEMAQWSRY